MPFRTGLITSARVSPVTALADFNPGPSPTCDQNLRFRGSWSRQQGKTAPQPPHGKRSSSRSPSVRRCFACDGDTDSGSLALQDAPAELGAAIAALCREREARQVHEAGLTRAAEIRGRPASCRQQLKETAVKEADKMPSSARRPSALSKKSLSEKTSSAEAGLKQVDVAGRSSPTPSGASSAARRPWGDLPANVVRILEHHRRQGIERQKAYLVFMSEEGKSRRRRMSCEALDMHSDNTRSARSTPSPSPRSRRSPKLLRADQSRVPSKTAEGGGTPRNVPQTARSSPSPGPTGRKSLHVADGQCGKQIESAPSRDLSNDSRNSARASAPPPSTSLTPQRRAPESSAASPELQLQNSSVSRNQQRTPPSQDSAPNVEEATVPVEVPQQNKETKTSHSGSSDCVPSETGIESFAIRMKPKKGRSASEDGGKKFSASSDVARCIRSSLGRSTRATRLSTGEQEEHGISNAHENGDTNMKVAKFSIIEWSSERDTGRLAARNLVDGTRGTMWESAGPPEQHIVLDLGSSCLLSAITMRCTGTQMDPKDMSIQRGCTEEGPWVSFRRCFVEAGPLNRDRQTQKLAFEDKVCARYWKLIVHQCWGSKCSVRILAPLTVFATRSVETRLARNRSLSTMFSEVLNLSKEERETREIARQHGISLDHAEKISAEFYKFGLQKRGSLSYPEFANVVRTLTIARMETTLFSAKGGDVPESRIRHLWQEVDNDGNGLVELPEFMLWFHRMFFDDLQPSMTRPLSGDSARSARSPTERYYASFGRSRLQRPIGNLSRTHR